MKLYLMRHGESPAASDAGVATDAERPLSPQGRADARKAARNLGAQGGRPALILVSPLTRAQQTAREAAQAMRPSLPARTFEPLSNQIGGRELLEKLRPEIAAATELLLIGHQPQLGELASHLTGLSLPLMPAGMIALELLGTGKARLLWFTNPDEIL